MRKQKQVHLAAIKHLDFAIAASIAKVYRYLPIHVNESSLLKFG